MSVGHGLDCVKPVNILVDCPESPDGKIKLRVPCGRCVACRMRRAREWSLRLECESKYYTDICFTTLTYNDFSIPFNIYKLSSSNEELIEEYVRGQSLAECAVFPFDNTYFFPTLCSRDLQLFIKRLRKCLNYPIRFYAVGEYGTIRSRPHYHIMFFGLKPKDWEFVQSCWHYGFVMNKPFYPETCVYVAGYIQKKLYGNDRNNYRVPEFLRSSKGIGLNWLMDNYKNIDPDNPILWIKGYPHALPRYFRKKLVEIGYLPELNILEYASQIWEAEDDLSFFCYKNDITLDSYYKNRENILNEKLKKKNLKRDTNNEF